ncbi:MAG: hypothetical protein QXE80_03365 [Pyrobaculum sp.]
MVTANVTFRNLATPFKNYETIPSGYSCTYDSRLTVATSPGKFEITFPASFVPNIAEPGNNNNFLLLATLQKASYSTSVTLFGAITVTAQLQSNKPIKLLFGLYCQESNSEILKIYDSVTLDQVKKRLKFATFAQDDSDNKTYSMFVALSATEPGTVVQSGVVTFENPVFVSLPTDVYSIQPSISDWFTPQVNNLRDLATTNYFVGPGNLRLTGLGWLNLLLPAIDGTQTVSVQLPPITFLTASSFTAPDVIYEPYTLDLTGFITNEAKQRVDSYQITVNNLPQDFTLTPYGILKIPPKSGEYSELNRSLAVKYTFLFESEEVEFPFVLYYSRYNSAPSITIPTKVLYAPNQTFEITVSDEAVETVDIRIEYSNDLLELVSQQSTAQTKRFTFITKPVSTTATGFVSVEATDKANASSSRTYNFQLKPRTLTVVHSTPQPISEGETKSITLTAYDESNNPVDLTYANITTFSMYLTVQRAGNVLTYSVNTDILSQPFIEDTIDVTVQLDGYSPVSLSIPIRSSNVGPAWQSIPVLNCVAGSVLTIPVSDYVVNPEPQGRIVRMETTCPFARINYSFADSKWYMELRPTLRDLGTKNYSITAYDSFLHSATTNFTVAVQEPSNLPSLAIPDQTITVGQKLKLYLNAYLQNIYPEEIRKITITEGPGIIKEE